MRFPASALVFAAVLAPVAASAQAPAPAATPAAGYTTADTDVGTLLDDPAAKAVLARHLPALVASDQIDMARSMTLKAMQSYAPDMLTDKALADIDADLAKLPVKK
jgi:para-nitrobenzyl esterase